MLDQPELGRALSLFDGVAAQPGGGMRNLLDRDERLLFIASHPTLLAAVHALLSPRPQILQYDGINQPFGAGDQTCAPCSDASALRTSLPPCALCLTVAPTLLADHADFSFYSSGVTLMLNAGVYLDGLTEQNGPIWVVPGSHRQPPHGRPTVRDGRLPLPPDGRRTHGLQDGRPVLAPPGSAVLFDCCTWHHGGGTKDSGRRRRAVFPTYGHFWMKRFESWLPLATTERWPLATAEERELLGIELRGKSEYGGYTDSPPVRKGLDGRWLE